MEYTRRSKLWCKHWDDRRKLEYCHAQKSNHFDCAKCPHYQDIRAVTIPTCRDIQEARELAYLDTVRLRMF